LAPIESKFLSIKGGIKKMANEFGYAGSILKVDLSQGSMVDIPTMDYADRFVGGRGFAAKIYWDGVPPEAKAFDPQNRLIFVNGPLAGFTGLAGSRWQICGKSPAITPEFFSYANLGGSWGAWLKFAGYDAVIIEGKSDKPVYLLIQDGSAEIKDASFLWGKGAIEAREILKGMLGGSIRVAAIGPAGDNMAVMANVIADDDASGSCGFGAVMGSKKLKAIAVGTNKRKAIAANPEKLQELVKHISRLRKDSRFIFSGPHRMWSSYVPENLKLNPKLKKASCYGCISGCTRAMYEAENGERGKYLCVAAVFYADPSKKLGEWNDVHFHASRICNDYGLDVFSMAAIIGWLQKCYHAGILTDEKVGIPISKMGSIEFIQTLARKVSLREGFGDILAEGSAKANKKLGLGKKGEDYLICTRGMTLVAGDPRGVGYGFGLGYAMGTRGGCDHLRACASIDFVSFLYPGLAESITGIKGEIKPFNKLGKPRLVFYEENQKAITDSLEVCCFTTHFAYTVLARDQVEYLNACTGLDFTEEELLKIGERIYNLERAYWARILSGKREDILPKRFTSEPLPKSIPDQVNFGNVIDITDMLKEYYKIRGYELNTGFPGDKRLKELGLKDVAEELKPYREKYKSLSK